MPLDTAACQEHAAHIAAQGRSSSRASGMSVKALAVCGRPISGVAAIIVFWPLPRTVTAASDTGDGALSTATQAEGSCFIVITSRAFGASGFLFGRQGSSVNHQASDLSQPSPAATSAWPLQPTEPGWHPIRTCI